MAANEPLQSGPRYRLVAKLGEGSFAEVLRVSDRLRGEEVALKRFKRSVPRADLIALLQGEFLALAQLDHPGIPRVYDVSVGGERAPFFTMEYLRGPDLLTGLRRGRAGPLDPGDLRALLGTFLSILSTLHYIHARGILHGDLKPSNILFRDSNPRAARSETAVVLVDFGLHLAQARGTGISGTLRYLAPEQIREGSLSPQTDLFSLGVLLYEVCTGENPFVAIDPLARASGNFPDVAPLSQHAPGLPPALDEVVARLLALDPLLRYRTAEAARRDLLRVAGWSQDRIRGALRRGFRFDAGLAGLAEPLASIRRQNAEICANGLGRVRAIEVAAGMDPNRLLRQVRHDVQAGSGKFVSWTLRDETFVDVAARIRSHVSSGAPTARRTRGGPAASSFPPPQEDVSLERLHAFDALLVDLRSLVAAEGRSAEPRRPTVVAFAGVEAARGAFHEFLGYLARQADTIPALILCVGEPGPWSGRVPARERVEPLTEDDIEALLEANLGRIADRRRVARVLHDRTRGQRELLTALIEDLVAAGVVLPGVTGCTVDLAALRTRRLPLQPLRAFLRRAAALGRSDRVSLEAIAVLGERFDLAAVCAVLCEPPRRALPILERLLAAGILESQGTVAEHPVFRFRIPDAPRHLASTSTPRIQRVSLRRAAAHLARRVADGDESHRERLAALLESLGKLAAAAASRMALAQRFRDGHEPDRAFEQLQGAERLLRRARKPLPRPKIEALADLALQLGRSADAHRYASRLLREGGGTLRRGRSALLRLALAQLQAGNRRHARARLEECLAACGERPVAEGVEARRLLARVEANEGRAERAEELYDAAVSGALELRPPQRDLTLRVLMGQGEFRLAGGDLEGAESCFARALRLSRHASAQAWRCRVLLGLGEVGLERSLPAAVSHFTQAAGEAARQGDPVVEAWARYNLGIALADRGEGDAARESYLRARDLFERSGCWDVARAEAQLGNLARDRGDFDEAEEHYRRFEALSTGMAPEHPSQRLYRLNRWRLWLLQGKAAAVRKALAAAAADHGADQPRRQMAFVWLTGLAARACDANDQARTAAEQLLELARRNGSAFFEAEARLALAAAPREDEGAEAARAHALAARGFARKLGNRILEARAEMLLAERAIAGGRGGGDPLPHLDAAQEILDRGRLRPLLEQALAMRRRWEEIMNATSAEPPTRIRRERETLYRASEIIRSYSDLPELLEKLLSAAVELMNAERGLIFLRSGPGRPLDLGASLGGDDEDVRRDAGRISQTILRQSLQEARPILSTNAMADPRFRDNRSVMNYGIRSFICAPLMLPERALGTLYIDHRRTSNRFEEADAEFLMAFAGFAAAAIDNAARQGRMERAVQRLTREARAGWHPGQLIGESAVMRAVLKVVAKVAPGEASVVIRGETGTGKELIARMIHEESRRARGPFVAVNSAAIPTTLVESELFGVAAGAATDVSERAGRFEEAGGGTLFLDEIADLPLAAQAKILRALQERRIERVGSNRTIQVDFRLVVATQSDLAAAVREGRFRSDLYYRLNVVEIALPPLRDRLDDIPLLVRHYVDRYCRELRRVPLEISSEVLATYCKHGWPGNVRELKNAVERAALLAEDGTLPPFTAIEPAVSPTSFIEEAFAQRLGERELRHVYARHAFERLGRNKLKTCEFLGIDFKTLQARLLPNR